MMSSEKKKFYIALSRTIDDEAQKNYVNLSIVLKKLKMFIDGYFFGSTLFYASFIHLKRNGDFCAQTCYTMSYFVDYIGSGTGLG